MGLPLEGTMDIADFSNSLHGLWRRIAFLHQRAREAHAREPLVMELLEGLGTALEELRVAEEELHQQVDELATSHLAVEAERQRYQELFDFAPNGYVVTDPQGRILEANRAAAALLNIAQDELIRKPLAVFVAMPDRRSFRTQLTWLQNGAGIHEWEVCLQPWNRPAFPAALSCTASHGAQGVVVRLRWLLHDISERKQAEEAIRKANEELERQVEERTLALTGLTGQLRHDIAKRAVIEGQLRDSLKEKEVLIREVNHRVKNNMQVVTSLLNLQSSQIEEPHIQELFRESQHRIQTMALIHDALYASSDLAHLDLAPFTATLVSYLFSSYGVDHDRITLQVQTDAVMVNPDIAIPYGLILNELVSNCLKHAFPPGGNGEVQIELRRRSTVQATLSVRDNGRGFPAEVDFRSAESLGLQLITALVEQLRGTLTLDPHAGTSFTLWFTTPTFGESA
jgi:PAS domain S-box-containing protein